jgi:transcriptional regulator with XRE-family HTH domain
MSKRNKIVIESDEAKFLKETRQNAGLSLQEVADLLNVSKQQVHLMESGRADINADYLRLFKTKVAILGRESRPISAQPLKDSCPNIKQLCLAKIEKLPSADLEKLNSYLDQLLFFK